MSTSLKEIRQASNLTLEEASARIRELVPDAPQTIVGLHHIERRGTKRYPLLVAMAKVYGRPLEEIAAAAGNDFPEG